MLNGNMQTQSMLKEDQALVSQSYKKGLQSKALMDHFQEDNLRRMCNKRNQVDTKIRELEFAKMQNQRHLYEQQMKKQFKEHVKNQYSKVYDHMIDERKKKEKEERDRELWLQKNLLEKPSWIKDIHEQKQIQLRKREQYAKQLGKNLKEQEERRVVEARLFKEQQGKMKYEPEQNINKKTAQYKHPPQKKIYSDPKQTSMLGVRQALDWSQNSQIHMPESKSQTITPRLDRMLKVQEQKYYGKGLSAQYKSQNQKKYFERNPEVSPRSNNSDKPQHYNPILNPIPHYYRNPNVLNLISKYG